MKENDLILGGFAKAHARELSAAELDGFEWLLEQKDQEIYDWLSGRVDAPAGFLPSLLAKLRNFHPGLPSGEKD